MLACLCCHKLQACDLHAQAVRFPLMAAQQLCEVGQHPLAASSPSLQVHIYCIWTLPGLTLPTLLTSASSGEGMCLNAGWYHPC